MQPLIRRVNSRIVASPPRELIGQAEECCQHAGRSRREFVALIQKPAATSGQVGMDLSQYLSEQSEEFYGCLGNLPRLLIEAPMRPLLEASRRG